MRPPVEFYEIDPSEGPIGVKTKLKASLEHTFRDILEIVETNQPDFKKDVSDRKRTKNLTASVKYGLDGRISNFSLLHF